MEDAGKVLLANIKAHIRRKKMKRLIWKLLSIFRLDRRRYVQGRWSHPERREPLQK